MAILGTNSTLLDVFDSLAMPVLVTDRRGKIVSMNATSSLVFQYSISELRGGDLRSIIDVSDGFVNQHPAPVSHRVDQAAPGSSFEAICTKKNGDSFAAKATFVPYPGEELEILVLQDMSSQKRLLQRSSQRTKELSIFNAFARLQTLHSGTQAILGETIEMLLSHMGADRGWIHLAEPDEGTLGMVSAGGVPEPQLRDMARLSPGEGLEGKVFASGRPLLVKTASSDPRVRRGGALAESIVGVPISSKGVSLGVLCIGSFKKDFFSSMDVHLLAIIGTQLGVEIENMRLISELRKKMEERQLANELSGILNSSLSIGTIFRMTVSEIKKLIDYDRASLLLYNEKEDNLLIFALDTGMKTEMRKGITAPISGTSAGWVVRNNSPWINEDLRETEFPLDKRLFREGIRSTISIPLSHDRILGVFNLDSSQVSKYSQKDLAILLPVAKQMSIALENALLFEQISREKKEWEKTFDAITDMVWVEDTKQQVIRANRALLRRTGLTSAQMTLQKCSDLLGKVGIPARDCICEETVSEKRPCFRELKGSGGSIFHFWAYPLIDDEGQLFSLVHYLKDVTSQKRLEHQIIRSDRLASLGTLVAGIAHEINNPLGIIAGYAEALLNRAQEQSLAENRAFEDFPEYLATIHNEIFRCKGILRSLLDFARPSSGTHREIDINELIKEVILLVNHRAKRLNHVVELRLNRELPKIVADPGSLRQLFMNIIINSLYFTPEGGSITITSRMDAGENALESDSPGIVVTIADTGAGIPAHVINRIFDPFYTTKPVGEGTGLGLAICHKIVEEHRGNISAESDEGKGTTFTIRLPAGNNDQGTGS